MDIPDISGPKRRVNLSGLIPLSTSGLILWSYLTGGAQNLCRPLDTAIPHLLSSKIPFWPMIEQWLINCQQQTWMLILIGLFAVAGVFVAADYFIWPTKMINNYKELAKGLWLRRVLLLPFYPVLFFYLKIAADQYF